MGVQVRQKGGKWYVFIKHQSQRKAKCIGSDKRVAVQVQKQLEAKLALGDVGLLKEEPAVVKITVDIYGHTRQGMSTHLVDQLTQLSATLAQPDYQCAS